MGDVAADGTSDTPEARGSYLEPSAARERVRNTVLGQDDGSRSEGRKQPEAIAVLAEHLRVFVAAGDLEAARVASDPIARLLGSAVDAARVAVVDSTGSASGG